MTTFRALRTFCGLSNREAARIFDIAIKSVENMNAGRSRLPPTLRDEMLNLAGRINDRADGILAGIEKTMEETDPPPEKMELAAPAGEDDAVRLLGLPCIGAWMAMAGMVIAGSDIPVEIVPAGSTPAVRAARDARRPAK